MVVSVGIDVSKDKHDCFIVSSEGEVLRHSSYVNASDFRSGSIAFFLIQFAFHWMKLFAVPFSRGLVTAQLMALPVC